MVKITLKELFASVNYISDGHTSIKILILLLLMSFIVYLSYFIFSKLLYRNSNLTTDHKLSFALLWSSITYLVVFAILLIILFYYVGFHYINWSDYRTYFAFFKNQPQSLLPYILPFIADSIFYIVKSQQLNNSIKSY